MADEPQSSHSSDDEQKRVHERLWLPILIPVVIFLFAVLVIYGLSRIYLELNRVSVGDVTMATPLAIGVALAILGIAAYLASRPSVPVWQYAAIGGLAMVMLAGGSIAATLIEDEEHEPQVNGGTATPPPTGGIQVELAEFKVTVSPETAPPGPTTFDVINAGAIIHNLRVIKSDLAPDALPVTNNMVDESQVDVVASSDSDLDAGTSVTVDAPLDPGSYVLICNIPTHYDAGMHAAFTAQ